MTPKTVPIICSHAPRHIVYVPAVRDPHLSYTEGKRGLWRCSWCGARVRVVA